MIQRFEGLQQYHHLEVSDRDEDGSLFFNPKTYRTYRVMDGQWDDVSLRYPVSDEADFMIRTQNMRSGQSNYMPKLPVPLPEQTQDINYEEV